MTDDTTRTGRGPSVHELLRLTDASELLRRNELAAEAERRATEAVAKAIDPHTEANELLELAVAATEAVAVVRRQCDLTTSTYLTEWTRDEIWRLLKALRAGPMEPIQLGGQHLGAGFERKPPPATNAVTGQALSPSAPIGRLVDIGAADIGPLERKLAARRAEAPDSDG